MSKKLFYLVLITSYAYGSEGIERALSRLTMTTDMLLSIGDEMIDQPITGLFLVQDTVSIDVNIVSEYTYQIIIWTESSFNYADFWLIDPNGDIPRGGLGDHITFAIIPDSSKAGTWSLNMELLEGAYSDTAYYAVAVLRAKNQL